MDKLKDNTLWRIWQAEFSRLLRGGSPKAFQSLWWLALGVILGLANPHQVAFFLNLPKDRLYRTLGSFSVADWIRLIQEMFLRLAADQLLKLQGQSPSTRSRAAVILACDDTVLQRFAKALSYLGTWWSGQRQSIAKGHNLLVVVLKVQEKVYPVALWIMSKKGPRNRRPERLIVLLEQVYQRFTRLGVDCSRISVTMDSWSLSQAMVEARETIGFRDLTGPMKSAWKLETCFGKTAAGVVGQGELEALWGTDRPGKRLKAFSPTLGWGTMVCADFGRRRVLWSNGILRACEVINRYRAHHWVEVFFRRCKHTLALGNMALRGRGGAWASVGVPLLAYGLVLIIQKTLRMGFDQICAHLRKLAIERHLHGVLPCNIDSS